MGDFHTRELPSVLHYLHELFTHGSETIPLSMCEGAPQIIAHTQISSYWALKSAPRSDKVNAPLGLDTSRTTEWLQAAVLVAQLMAVLPLVEH